MGGTENANALRSGGLIDDSDTPLPDQYYEVIEEMSADEIEALLSIKQRLAEHGILTAPVTASRPGRGEDMVPF